MKTLYFECGMGAAGDMLMAALLELHDNPDEFLKTLNSAGIPGVTVTTCPSVKCGITGTHITVKVNGQEEHSHDDAHKHHHDHSHEHHHSHESHHEHNHSHEHHEHEHNHNHEHEHNAHHHSSYANIEHLISHLHISDYVKHNALAVYKLIAEAESHAHGVPITQIHFHEVGEMDAVADIVGVCMLIEELAPEKILSSPINVGSGYVRCSHGVLPVPAPATAFILKKVPIYSDHIQGELCTPTGAALLKHFASEFRGMPMISVGKLGYGMGTKNFEKANCVRAFIGEADYKCDEVIELVCNLDDMTPEALAFVQQHLMDDGALDVYITPIIMKKGRPGFILTCMCRVSDRERMRFLIFKHTTTLGMREYYTNNRYALQKEDSIVKTQMGNVRVKTSHGYGVKKSKPEYDDIAKIAKEHNISIQDVLQKLEVE
ncbi:MAG: nickel pincer cofactor biosynthesis protein LarC [Defluviitaleaceae bacterium]|nr:nickel pincer cofactor biosynthesis protein LarC [Defluviitaleaceae bacterium]